jgi:23S rRNA (uridine2552-2'-O)-methyltransferase
VAKRPSSSRWKQRQARDPFVRRARAEGLRSRAVFKLDELQQKGRLLRAGNVVVDLGAAPGSWSAYARSVVGDKGRVIALDVLPLDDLPGVEYIRGDFTDEETERKLLETVGNRSVDLVLSDMAPNISGNWSVDQPRAMRLAELALLFALRVLRPGGSVVLKLFQGEGFEALVRAARTAFRTVKLRKPSASRAESREIYLVATNYRV